MANDWDGILGQYSAPVRSWPGEEAMDEEARANLAAMKPTAPEKLRPDEAYRGAFLPFRETVSGQHEWAVPGFLQDIWDSAKAVRDTSGTGLGPMIRPSKLPLEEMEQIIGHSMAGAMTGVTGGLARAAVAPRLAAGEVEFGIFGGRRGAENLAAKGETRPLQALDMLERMERDGASREEIWAATNEILKDSPYAGAFRGVDAKPKFEIDDSRAKIVNDRGRLGDALQHDDLFSSYPSLAKADLLLEPAAGGRYVPREWNKAEGRNAPESIGIGEDHYRRYPGIPTPESVAVHEAQHGVQAREGFASGADLDNLRAIARSAHPNADPAAIDAAVHEAYLQHAGEVEARAVQARRDLSPDERRSRPPWLDYDVPESQQIVRFGDKGPQMSVEDALPMDQASRMARAREMGFDTDKTLYHGTGKDFSEFDPGTTGQGRKRNIFLTDNPEIADIYANSKNYGLKGGGNPAIYPVYAKAEKPLIVSDKGPDGSFGWVSDNLAAALGVDHPPPGRYGALYDEARRQGYDQVQIREMTDLGGEQTQYIPLEAKNIRSVNAAFDPSKKDSANLLASHRVPLPVSRDDERRETLDELLKLYSKEYP